MRRQRPQLQFLAMRVIESYCHIAFPPQTTLPEVHPAPEHTALRTIPPDVYFHGTGHVEPQYPK